MVRKPGAAARARPVRAGPQHSDSGAGWYAVEGYRTAKRVRLQSLRQRIDGVEVHAEPLHGKILRFGQTRVTPSLDVYNLTNADPVLAQSNAFGNWLRPQEILNARFVELSVNADF
jgi:hypothetical protein